MNDSRDAGFLHFIDAVAKREKCVTGDDAVAAALACLQAGDEAAIQAAHLSGPGSQQHAAFCENDRVGFPVSTNFPRKPQVGLFLVGWFARCNDLPVGVRLRQVVSILHQQAANLFDRTIAAYRALETLLADGRVRAIGVSNFTPAAIDRLMDAATVVPAVNQIELHPYHSQPATQKADAALGIVTQAWSPIGGITFYREGDSKSTLEDPTILKIAAQHGKTAAQVMLRWHLQEGRSVIPKSVKTARIAENFDVFDLLIVVGSLICDTLLKIFDGAVEGQLRC